LAVYLYIFVVALITGLSALFALILTLLFPKFRTWPPPDKRSWQFWFWYLLTAIWVPGLIVVGILDWESFWYTHWSRFIIGGLSVSFGSFFIVWGMRTLSWHQSLGLKGTFRTKGPYQYIRNPQYVGNVLLTAGIILITNSFMAIVVGILAILWFVLAPFSEEPWVREQFGREYDEYCKSVPRFVGKASFKRKS